MKRVLNIAIAISFILVLCISCGKKENINTPPSTIVDNSAGEDTGDNTTNNTDNETDGNTNNNAGDVNPNNPQVQEEYTFTAKVLETKDGLLIAPNEESNEYKSSDKISVHTNDTKFFDKDGNEITIDKLQVGDTISVVYNGTIMESYPAQIGAISITLTEDKELLEAYKAIIDDIYKEDDGLNSDISVIALDLEDITDLTEGELTRLVEMVKESYSVEVMKATYKELIEQGLVDEDKLYFEKGILIRIIEPKYDKDKKLLTYGIEKWRSGLGAIGSNEASAQYEDGVWKITKENMWIS
jgi:hypothetical protein